MTTSAHLVRGCVLALTVAIVPACSWLGASDIERDAIANLPVVDDDRAFDPSQAVDDDDDLERPWLRAEDEQEQDAFANDGTSAAEAHPAESSAAESTAKGATDRARAADASADGKAPTAPAARVTSTSEPMASATARPTGERATKPTKRAARTDASRAADGEKERPRDGDKERPRDGEKERPRDGEVGPKIPEDEHVATPAEVDALRTERRRKLDELVAAKGDVAAKLELARNPPPEPIGKAKSTAWTVTDYALEGVLLAIAAGVVAGAWTLARSFPKSVASMVVAGVFVAVLVVTQGE